MATSRYWIHGYFYYWLHWAVSEAGGKDGSGSWLLGEKVKNISVLTAKETLVLGKAAIG